MGYTSLGYFFAVIIMIMLYYIAPQKIRWIVLLAGSIWFYLEIAPAMMQRLLLLSSIVVSYCAAIMISRIEDDQNSVNRKVVLFLGIFVSILPLLTIKLNGFLVDRGSVSIIVPVGISFYSLQLVAYLVDVYKGIIEPQLNPLKYALFISFFPQIIQGPIPRYKQLGSQLFDGNKYQFDNLVRGFQLVIWAFFLKYMIADKAAVIVDRVFDNYLGYSGLYVWVAGILYSIQLYADFLSCTTMSMGVARMFGIQLENNFNHPYFSKSIKEFWRRWHMTLSYWLRDYIYIPLGGNKKGKINKWINILITFLVSGLWHGNSWKFVFWGLLHAIYQIVGEIRNIILKIIGHDQSDTENQKLQDIGRQVVTFILVMFAWVIFRAESLRASIVMLKSMIFSFNPWILFDDSLFNLGLSWKECAVLAISIAVFFSISKIQEAGNIICDIINKQNIIFRWAIYLLAIWVIWIFGTYGYGYNAKDFIYGGF